MNDDADTDPPPASNPAPGSAGDRKKSRKHSLEDLTKQPIKKAGWMQKKGGGNSSKGRRNWKRRWFLLRGNRLYYFKKPVDADQNPLPKPKGEIAIFGLVAEPYEDHHSRPYMLSLFTADEQGDPCVDQRVYYLDAMSETEQTQWVSCLNSASVLLSMARENAVAPFCSALGLQADDIDALTTRAIKLAYRKAALTHHPDKGGDMDVFNAISEAHETLLEMKQLAELEAAEWTAYEVLVPYSEDGMGLHLVEKDEPPLCRPMVKRVIEGKVVHSLGRLAVGDLLVAVDGSDVRGCDFQEAMALMRAFGPEGMTLRFLRCNAGPPDMEQYATDYETQSDDGVPERRSGSESDDAGTAAPAAPPPVPPPMPPPAPPPGVPSDAPARAAVEAQAQARARAHATSTVGGAHDSAPPPLAPPYAVSLAVLRGQSRARPVSLSRSPVHAPLQQHVAPRSPLDALDPAIAARSRRLSAARRRGGAGGNGASAESLLSRAAGTRRAAHERGGALLSQAELALFERATRSFSHHDALHASASAGGGRTSTSTSTSTEPGAHRGAGEAGAGAAGGADASAYAAAGAPAGAPAGVNVYSAGASTCAEDDAQCIAAQDAALHWAIADAVGSRNFRRAEQLKCTLDGLHSLRVALAEDAASGTAGSSPSGASLHARLRQRMAAAVEAENYLLAGDLKHQLEALRPLEEVATGAGSD
eukprot:g2497.t1